MLLVPDYLLINPPIVQQQAAAMRQFVASLGHQATDVLDAAQRSRSATSHTSSALASAISLFSDRWAEELTLNGSILSALLDELSNFCSAAASTDQTGAASIDGQP